MDWNKDAQPSRDLLNGLFKRMRKTKQEDTHESFELGRLTGVVESLNSQISELKTTMQNHLESAVTRREHDDLAEEVKELKAMMTGTESTIMAWNFFRKYGYKIGMLIVLCGLFISLMLIKEVHAIAVSHEMVANLLNTTEKIVK